MLRVSRKADYALIALKHLAQQSGTQTWSAADISSTYGISGPLLAKVLQALAKKGLVRSRHGASGGYTLARDPATVTVLEVLQAIDGPVSITSCTTPNGNCDHLPNCTVRDPLVRINGAVLKVLKGVTLLQLAEEDSAAPVVGLTN